MDSGDFDGADLRNFVAQYRHLIEKVPWHLTDLIHRLPSGTAQTQALKMLEVELGPPSQLELFDLSAAAQGAIAAERSKAMGHLLSTYEYAFEHSDRAAFCALIVPTMQSSELMAAVRRCISRYYSDSSSVHEYWRRREDRDAFYAQWMVKGLESVMNPDDNITPCARAVNGAWWQFLNEQDSWCSSAKYARRRVSL